MSWSEAIIIAFLGMIVVPPIVGSLFDLFDKPHKDRDPDAWARLKDEQEEMSRKIIAERTKLNPPRSWIADCLDQEWGAAKGWRFVVFGIAWVIIVTVASIFL